MVTLTAVLEFGLLVAGGAVIYMIIRGWLPKAAEFDFEPELSITRKDGWAFLDLVLTNHSKKNIWAEQATFVLDDLNADFQGATAKGQETLRIRQELGRGETLRISLVETFYVAAGKPQGEYSFLASGTVRYRADNTWYEIGLHTHRVRMVALNAVRLLRMRWYDQTTPAAAPRAPAPARSRATSTSADALGRLAAPHFPSSVSGNRIRRFRTEPLFRTACCGGYSRSSYRFRRA